MKNKPCPTTAEIPHEAHTWRKHTTGKIRHCPGTAERETPRPEPTDVFQNTHQAFSGAVEGINDLLRQKDHPVPSDWPVEPPTPNGDQSPSLCVRMKPPYEAHGAHDACPGLPAHPSTQIGGMTYVRPEER